MTGSLDLCCRFDDHLSAKTVEEPQIWHLCRQSSAAAAAQCLHTHPGTLPLMAPYGRGLVIIISLCLQRIKCSPESRIEITRSILASAKSGKNAVMLFALEYEPEHWIQSVLARLWAVTHCILFSWGTQMNGSQIEWRRLFAVTTGQWLGTVVRSNDFLLYGIMLLFPALSWALIVSSPSFRILLQFARSFFFTFILFGTGSKASEELWRLATSQYIGTIRANHSLSWPESFFGKSQFEWFTVSVSLFA